MTASSFVPGPVRLAWRSWPQIGDLTTGARRAAVLVPVGAVEQHGPHLPTGVDIWISSAVALAVAERMANVLVAEPIPYGSSAHHRAFPGTISLRPSTFIALVCDVCRCLVEDGLFPILVNGHGGNRGALQVAVSELGASGVRVAACSYFDLIRTEVQAVLPDARFGTGHACALETSLMMHLFPASVQRGAIPPEGTPSCWPDPHLYAADPITVWRGFEEINPTGVIGRPIDASPEAGVKLFSAAVIRLSEAVQRIKENYKV